MHAVNSEANESSDEKSKSYHSCIWEHKLTKWALYNARELQDWSLAAKRTDASAYNHSLHSAFSLPTDVMKTVSFDVPLSIKG